MGMMKVLNIWLDGSATQHYFLCLKVIILTCLQAWPYAVNLENVVAITYVQVAFPPSVWSRFFCSVLAELFTRTN